MATQSDRPLNETQFLILLVLVDRERHGYGIVKEIEVRTGGRVRLEPGNLYRFVKKLMELGFLRDAEAPRGADAHERRRYFALTEDGRIALRDDAARMRSLVQALEARLTP